MKKRYLIFIIIVIMLSSSNQVYAANKCKLIFNNQVLPIHVFEVNGTAYIPVRFIAEKFNFPVDFKAPNTVIIKVKNKEQLNKLSFGASKQNQRLPILNMGEKSFNLFFDTEKAPVSIFEIKGTAYISARFIVENFGAFIDYKSRNTVIIKTNNKFNQFSNTSSAGDTSSLPELKVGENITKDSITYCIESVTYYTSSSGTKKAIIAFYEKKNDDSVFDPHVKMGVLYGNKSDFVFPFTYEISYFSDNTSNYKHQKCEILDDGGILAIKYYPDNGNAPIAKWINK